MFITLNKLKEIYSSLQLGFYFLGLAICYITHDSNFISECNAEIGTLLKGWKQTPRLPKFI